MHQCRFLRVTLARAAVNGLLAISLIGCGGNGNGPTDMPGASTPAGGSGPLKSDALVSHLECNSSCTVSLTGNAGDAQNSLAWAPTTSTAILERSATSGGPYTPVQGCQQTSGTCTDQGLFTGATYFYVVTDLSGNVQSNELNLVPHPAPTAARQARYALLMSQLQKELASNLAIWNNPKPNQYFWTRDLVAMAYLELLVNPPGSANYNTALSQAQNFLTTVFQSQITTGDSPWLEGGYGHIPMQININPVATGGTPAPGNIEDPNENEFATQCLIPMLMDFPLATYSQPIQDWFNGAGASLGLGLPAVITAMMYHSSDYPNNPNAPLYSSKVTDPVFPYYTNITITNSVELALLNLPGSPWANSAAYTQGTVGLHNWVDDVTQEFIHEGGSPTYYGVDLESLTLAYRYGPTAMHAQANWGLNALWSDIAASTFNANQAFARAASRDYDFIRGLGEADNPLFLEGLFNPPNSNATYVPGMNLQQVLMYANGVDPDGFQPGQDSLQYATPSTRTVAQIYNLPATSTSGIPNDVMTYITPDYALGTMSANYDSQDKILKLQLINTTAAGFPNFTIEPGVMPSPLSAPDSSDPGDDPYGYVTTGKPIHLSSHPVFVQDQGAVLGLIDLTTGEFKGNDRVATSFLFPSNATTLALLNESSDSLETFSESSIQVPFLSSSDHHVIDLCQGVVGAGTASQRGLEMTSGQVFGIRNGTGGMAFQIFYADGVGGYAPTFSIVSDGTGLLSGYHAGRLIACHYAGNAPPSSTAPIKLGFFLQAASCPNGDSDLLNLMISVRNLHIAPQISGTGKSQIWSVSVTPPSGSASLQAAQYVSSGNVASRQVGGQNIISHGFTVNQTDVFQFLLDNIP